MPARSINKDASEAIGNRVKSARMLTGCSRKAFSAVSNISMATLRIWEEPYENRYGLTQKGAERLVKAFNECGIYCSKNWLFTGDGAGPKLITTNPDAVSSEEAQITWGEEEAILKDIESFKNNNQDPIVAIVTDGSMLPTYSYGEYVAGNRSYSDDIKNLMGLNCIIELESKTLIRKISSINENNKYTVTSLNHDHEFSDPVITGLEIYSAAEIVWHRWRKKIKNIKV